MYDHAHHLNSVMAGADLLHPENQRVIPAFLGAMYHQFKQDNKYAIQLRNYGDRFRDQLPNHHLDNTTAAGKIVIAEVISTQFRQRMNVDSSPFQVSICYLHFSAFFVNNCYLRLEELLMTLIMTTIFPFNFT